MLERAYVETVLTEGGYLPLFARVALQALEEWKIGIANSNEFMRRAGPRERAAFLNRRIVELIEEELEHDPRAVVHEGKQNI
jgi:hypothetical protein